MSKDDLNVRLVELKKDLMKINAEASVSNPKNPGKISQIKKTIAKILTITNENNKQKGEIKKDE